MPACKPALPCFLLPVILGLALACGGGSGGGTGTTPGSGTTPGGGTGGNTGTDASLNGFVPFTGSTPSNIDLWNTDITHAAVDPSSAALVASIGASLNLHPDFGTDWNNAPIGIPYVVVPNDQPMVPVQFVSYPNESDKGPYPIPPDAPIEGGPASAGDRHVLVVDLTHLKLYELANAFPLNGGAQWQAACGAIFDLATDAPRPARWTSADAAGLPIFPGLVRYDEVVEARVIKHALRFTVPSTRMAYVPPARHWASSSSDPTLPPMGMRVRLKASVNISGFPANVQVILTALKTYGMFVADNGSSWYLSGTHDPRWDDNELHSLSSIAGSDFEVVAMDGLVAGP